eukprot:4258068-Prymnesium_polylepis.1
MLASAVQMRLPSARGQLSAAQAGAGCCTSCSSCTPLAAVRPRRCMAAGMQLEREQPFGNGL